MSYTSIWTSSFYLPEWLWMLPAGKKPKHFRQSLVTALEKSIGLVNWLPYVKNLILRIKSSQTARYRKLQLQTHFSSSKETVHIIYQILTYSYFHKLYKTMQLIFKGSIFFCTLHLLLLDLWTQKLLNMNWNKMLPCDLVIQPSTNAS